MSELRYFNPADTYNSLRTRGYTQVVVADAPARLIFISGQLSLDQTGAVVGAGDIEAQAKAVFANIEKSLKSVGGQLGNVAKLTAFDTDVVKHPPIIRKVRAEYFGTATPPTSTMIEVPRFSHPDILIEIDAVCVQ